mgnify:FL=1
MQFNTTSHRTVSLILAIFIFTFDQVTKFVVIRSLSIGESWPETGFFRITYVANTGSAFGLLSGLNHILIFVALMGIFVILWVLIRTSSEFLIKIALGLMLAGAAGNFVDRIAYGYVIDFIDVGPWYIFNVADSAIVISVFVLIFVFSFGGKSNSVKCDKEETNQNGYSNE